MMRVPFLCLFPKSTPSFGDVNLDRSARWTHFFILFLLSYTSMYSRISVPNERSRIYMAVALVDQATVSIDSSLKRFGRIGDRSIFKGVHYSDKAPGTGFLGALVYGIARLFTLPEDWKINDLLGLMRTWISLPFALLGWVWLRRLLDEYKLSRLTIEYTSLAWILGTTAFHYSTAFFSHQIASTLLIGSWLWMKRAIEYADSISLTSSLSPPTSLSDPSDPSHISSSPPQSSKSSLHPCILPLIWSGLLSGCAVCIEYQAALGVVCIGLYGGLFLSKFKSMFWSWIGAGFPLAVLLGSYHFACYEDPFTFPYQHLAAKTYRQIHSAGLAGVSSPEWAGFILWFFDLKRGLFSTSPIMGLLFFGFIPLFKLGVRQTLPLILFLFLVIGFASGSHIWGGDWGYGSRIIVFALGLLMIPVGFAVEKLRQMKGGTWLILSLLSYSIVLTQLIHLFFPEPWAKSKNPLVDVVIPMFSQGWVSPNHLTRLFPDLGIWSLIPALGIVGFLLVRLCIWSFDRRFWLMTVCVYFGTWGGLEYTARRPSASYQVQREWIKLIQYYEREEEHYRD